MLQRRSFSVHLGSIVPLERLRLCHRVDGTPLPREAIYWAPRYSSWQYPKNSSRPEYVLVPQVGCRLA
jgi:hypothetical protein